jgi:hypothetical protein
LLHHLREQNVFKEENSSNFQYIGFSMTIFPSGSAVVQPVGLNRHSASKSVRPIIADALD